jgi:hypothetical protein
MVADEPLAIVPSDLVGGNAPYYSVGLHVQRQSACVPQGPETEGSAEVVRTAPDAGEARSPSRTPTKRPFSARARIEASPGAEQDAGPGGPPDHVKQRPQQPRPSSAPYTRRQQHYVPQSYLISREVTVNIANAPSRVSWGGENPSSNQTSLTERQRWVNSTLALLHEAVEKMELISVVPTTRNPLKERELVALMQGDAEKAAQIGAHCQLEGQLRNACRAAGKQGAAGRPGGRKLVSAGGRGRPPLRCMASQRRVNMEEDVVSKAPAMPLQQKRPQRPAPSELGDVENGPALRTSTRDMCRLLRQLEPAALVPLKEPSGEMQVFLAAAQAMAEQAERRLRPSSEEDSRQQQQERETVLKLQRERKAQDELREELLLLQTGNEAIVDANYETILELKKEFHLVQERARQQLLDVEAAAADDEAEITEEHDGDIADQEDRAQHIHWGLQRDVDSAVEASSQQRNKVGLVFNISSIHAVQRGVKAALPWHSRSCLCVCAFAPSH